MLGPASSSPWTLKQVDIYSKSAFRISFQVDTYSPKTYLAIDDINYRLGTCSGAPPTSPLPPTQPPIPPALSMNCDFESDSLSYCNWRATVDNNWKIWAGPKDTKLNMPNADHTKQNNLGHYLYIVHSVVDNILMRKASLSIVNNVSITGTPTPFCLTLWYYMQGYMEVGLNVTITAPNHTLNKALLRENDKGEKWKMLQIEAPGDKQGYIYTLNAYTRFGE